MATKITLKKSGAIGNVPDPTELDFGELAINYADGVIYYKNTSEVVLPISSAGSQNVFETVNANGTLLIASSNDSILNIEAGEGIDITANALNDTLNISVDKISIGITDWILITENYTANNNDKIIADTSNGSFTINLPPSPELSFYVKITDGDDWSLNNLTVARNGSTIEGFESDLLLGTEISGVTVDLIYDGLTWQVTATTGARGPQGVQGAVGVQGAAGAPLERRHEYVEPIIYAGTAPQGTLDSDSIWALTKITLNEQGGFVSRETATDSWNNRLTATYG